MTYTAPSVTELGSVHALTLKPNGSAGNSGNAPSNGKSGGVRDGRSDVMGSPRPGGGMS